MPPPLGRLRGAVTMPVHVRMLPEEMAAVDALAAEISQQSYGASNSRKVLNPSSHANFPGGFS